MIKLDTWYIFSNEEDKSMFFDELEEYSIDRDELPSEFHKAQCLRVRETEDGFVLNYRTSYAPQYMRAEYYKGEIMGTQRGYVNASHPIVDEYFQEKSTECRHKFQKKVSEIKKASTVGIIAQSLIDEIRKNDINAMLEVDSLVPEHALPKKDRDAIVKAKETYDEEVHLLAQKCRRVTMLLDRTTNFEEYNAVLEDYDILKIIK